MDANDLRKEWEKESGLLEVGLDAVYRPDDGRVPYFRDAYVEHLEKLVLSQAERIEEMNDKMSQMTTYSYDIDVALKTITDLNKKIEEKDDKIIDYDKRCCDLFHSLNLEIEARKFASETATTHLNRALELEKQLDKINAERMSQYTNPNNEEK